MLLCCVAYKHIKTQKKRRGWLSIVDFGKNHCDAKFVVHSGEERQFPSGRTTPWTISHQSLFNCLLTTALQSGHNRTTEEDDNCACLSLWSLEDEDTAVIIFSQGQCIHSLSPSVPLSLSPPTLVYAQILNKCTIPMFWLFQFWSNVNTQQEWTYLKEKCNSNFN